MYHTFSYAVATTPQRFNGAVLTKAFVSFSPNNFSGTRWRWPQCDGGDVFVMIEPRVRSGDGGYGYGYGFRFRFGCAVIGKGWVLQALRFSPAQGRMIATHTPWYLILALILHFLGVIQPCVLWRCSVFVFWLLLYGYWMWSRELLYHRVRAATWDLELGAVLEEFLQLVVMMN